MSWLENESPLIRQHSVNIILCKVPALKVNSTKARKVLNTFSISLNNFKCVLGCLYLGDLNNKDILIFPRIFSPRCNGYESCFRQRLKKFQHIISKY